MPEYLLRVEPQHSGQRLDLVILSYFKDLQQGLSRTAIQGLIRNGRVTVNGRNLIRQHQKVKAGEEIRVHTGEKQESVLLPEDIPLDVVYEDSDLAVINKPPGMVVHPAPGNYEHTLVNALLHRLGNLSDVNPQRPGIVHRLDKDTSGIMVVAKNNFAHLELTKQFVQHSIKRKYAALVKGRVEFDENIIELPIGRNPLKRKNTTGRCINR